MTEDMNTITLTLEEAKCILASIALADHVGDCVGAVDVICEKLGLIGGLCLDNLKEQNLLPEHLKG